MTTNNPNNNTTIKNDKKTTNNIDFFIKELNNGKVCAFKTDTIWGLSTNPTKKENLQKIYALKNRQIDKPFVFLISKNQNLQEIVKPLNSIEKQLIKNFWPGPLTIIFEAKEDLPLMQFYQNTKTIALRMPNNDVTQSILQQLSYPLPSTSINTSGQEPLNNINDIKQNFNCNNILILDVPYTKATETSSTIVTAINGTLKIIRQGCITEKEILSKLTFSF